MANVSDLSEYEILRLQNIERNQTKLRTLGLAELKDGIKSSIKKKPKKTTVSRKRAPAAAPTRTSKRLKNVPVKKWCQ